MLFDVTFTNFESEFKKKYEDFQFKLFLLFKKRVMQFNQCPKSNRHNSRAGHNVHRKAVKERITCAIKAG